MGLVHLLASNCHSDRLALGIAMSKFLSIFKIMSISRVIIDLLIRLPNPGLPCYLFITKRAIFGRTCLGFFYFVVLLHVVGNFYPQTPMCGIGSRLLRSPYPLANVLRLGTFLWFIRME
jgi:hypothetical protein